MIFLSIYVILFTSCVTSATILLQNWQNVIEISQYFMISRYLTETYRRQCYLTLKYIKTILVIDWKGNSQLIILTQLFLFMFIDLSVPLLLFYIYFEILHERCQAINKTSMYIHYKVISFVKTFYYINFQQYILFLDPLCHCQLLTGTD